MAMVEVRVLVPEQRVAEYYRMVGMWLDRDASAKKSEPTLSPKSRYAPLQEHLEGVKGERKAVSMGFAEIGKVLGKALPKSAFAHRAWWANTGSHAQALAWLTAGWKVDRVDLPGKTVEFVRAPKG